MRFYDRIIRIWDGFVKEFCRFGTNKFPKRCVSE